MPLSARELLLVLRARDEASRVLRAFGNEFSHLNAAATQAARRNIAAGQALTGVGVGMIAVGGLAIKWLYDATKVARAYEQQVALTRTQVDQTGVSLKQIGDIGRRAAKDIAVPFEQLQPALFDIFSSMNVTIPQSEKLLRGFAKAAVAGATDIQTAGRATISILNAWNLPVSALNHVLDVQFRLVQKGVGTYQEFSRTIGRSIPSAVRAGQSIETLAGMLAFLTRNGLSAAMASASAGRALDAFSNPKVVTRLQEMGVRVKDASGQFRELGPIMTDLQKKFEGMTRPELAKALHNLFLGAGGTIQARRFFDMVLSSSKSVGEFNKRIKEMGNASGVMEQKYSDMADTTANKTVLLKNNWTLFKEAIGNALLPILNKLIEGLTKVAQKFNDLSPGTKKAIALFVLAGAVLTVLAGIVTVVAGAVLMLAGAIMLAGGPITLVVAIIGALILGLIALGAGLVVAYNKSETFRNIVNSAFKAIGDFWTNTLKPKLMEIKDLFVNHILPAAKKVAEEGLKGLKEGLNYVKAALDRNKPAIDDVKSAINTLYKALKKIVEYISDNVAPVVGPILRTAFRIAGASISMVIDLIGTLIRAFTRAVNVAKGIANGIKAAFNFSLQAEGARIAGSLVSGLFSKARDVASAAFSLAGIINNALRGRSPTKEGPLSGRGWTRYSGQSMVEALAKGMYDREHILRSASIAIAQAASPHAQANYRATYSMAGQRRESPVGLGQAGDRGNVTMYNDWTINTAEINPTQHSVELGRELVRRVPTI